MKIHQVKDFTEAILAYPFIESIDKFHHEIKIYLDFTYETYHTLSKSKGRRYNRKVCKTWINNYGETEQKALQTALIQLVDIVKQHKPETLNLPKTASLADIIGFNSAMDKYKLLKGIVDVQSNNG